MNSLFQELKRRKVFRVAVAYAVVGWVLAQVAAFAVETFAAPQWVQQIFVVFLVLGFPLAVLLAWAYEIMPAGIGADRGVQSGQPASQSTDQRVNYAILGLVVLVVVFQVTDRFLLSTEQGMENSSIPSAASVTRTDIILGPMDSYSHGGLRTSIALSPDGSKLAYTDFVDGINLLYIRELDQLIPSLIAEIPDHNTGANLFFSPDGEWLAFHGDAKLMKISVTGGNLQSLVDYSEYASPPFGGFWIDDQTLLFNERRGLSFLPSGGGPTTNLEFEAPIEGYYTVWPYVLPGGEAILVTAMDSSMGIEGQDIFLIDRATREVGVLIEGGHNARYTPSGHIIFMRSDALWAVPFDLDNLKITGAEKLVQPGISTNRTFGIAIYTFSENGRLIYMPGTDTWGQINSGALVWIDRDGNEEPLELSLNYLDDPRLSPNGQQLAVIHHSDDGSSDLWINDLRRGTFSPVTFSGNVRNPIWLPDSQRVLFEMEGRQGNWVVSANGATEAEQLFTSGNRMIPSSISRDEAWLVYTHYGSSRDIYMREMADGSANPRALLASEFHEINPAISPDGQWIAYASDESGINQVYVRPFPNVNGDKIQLSTTGGQEPLWGAGGKNLYYLNQSDRSLNSVTVNTESGFSFSNREVIYSGPDLVINDDWPKYAVDSDKQRFLIMKAGVNSELQALSTTNNSDGYTESVFTSLVLVDNWFEELKRLAPPDPQ